MAVKLLFAALGIIALALGVLGALLPVLPTVPFILLAAYAFSKSSRRLDRWLRRTRIYRETRRLMQDAKRGMTIGKKLRIMLPVTALMGISFYAADFLPARILLIIVWTAHVLVLVFRIPTRRGR